MTWDRLFVYGRIILADKLIWLVGFILDVVVFTVAGSFVALKFLIVETLYNLFYCIVYLLSFEPEKAFSLMKWWIGAAAGYVVKVRRIIHQRLVKSFKGQPTILCIEKDK